MHMRLKCCKPLVLARLTACFWTMAGTIGTRSWTGTMAIAAFVRWRGKEHHALQLLRVLFLSQKLQDSDLVLLTFDVTFLGVPASRTRFLMCKVFLTSHGKTFVQVQVVQCPLMCSRKAHSLHSAKGKSAHHLGRWMPSSCMAMSTWVPLASFGLKFVRAQQAALFTPQ